MHSQFNHAKDPKLCQHGGSFPVSIMRSMIQERSRGEDKDQDQEAELGPGRLLRLLMSPVFDMELRVQY